MAGKKTKLRLRAGESVGALAAEHDHENLRECFVDLPLVSTLASMDSAQCVILGRTGSGKSALLWHLENTLKNVSRVDPKEASFEYVGNSTIVRHLSELGVDLHVFYEYLWKHILTLHVIREFVGVRTDQSFASLVDRVRDFVARDRNRTIALQYLERHKDNFWRGAEQVSQEITSKITETLGAQAGLSAGAFTSRIQGGVEWSEQEKRAFRHRAQEIISNLQMRELNETINAIAELTAGQRYGESYILIDDLDARWGGDAPTQYSLIRALIECIKTFKRIANLKIVVAMREDLYEATVRATSDRHFQPEKFEGLLIHLRWTKAQLREVIEQRLNRLFQQRYTGQRVGIEDVFPNEVSGVKAATYLVDRTLRRPRDIIAFVNKILSSNEGAMLPLTRKALTTVEPSFSRDRCEALIYEWRSCHPHVETYLSAVARFSGPAVLADIDEARLYGLVCEVLAAERKPVDDVERIAQQVYERNKELVLTRLGRALLCCLFKVGAIGVKLSPSRPYMFCYDQHSTINDAEVGDDTKMIVHPMLLSALGGRDENAEAA